MEAVLITGMRVCDRLECDTAGTGIWTLQELKGTMWGLHTRKLLEQYTWELEFTLPPSWALSNTVFSHGSMNFGMACDYFPWNSVWKGMCVNSEPLPVLFDTLGNLTPKKSMTQHNFWAMRWEEIKFQRHSQEAWYQNPSVEYYLNKICISTLFESLNIWPS